MIDFQLLLRNPFREGENEYDASYENPESK